LALAANGLADSRDWPGIQQFHTFDGLFLSLFRLAGPSHRLTRQKTRSLEEALLVALEDSRNPIA
jgi:hypothetical protein